MLKVSNLRCGYGEKNIIDNLSFTMKEGESLCIIGSNGCGKTTLLKAISGLLAYDGSIKLYGKEIKKLKASEIGNDLAVLSQSSNIYFSFSVYDTVMLGRYIKLPKSIFAKPDKIHEEYVMHCLDTVGIADLKHREISTLSGGQMQKVLLARALAQEPKIILLDEPSNHLDIKSQMELFTFLQDWTKDGNHSVIGVLHDVSVALGFFERSLFMKSGDAIFIGSNNDVTRDNLTQTYDFDVVNYLTELNKSWRKFDVQK